MCIRLKAIITLKNKALKSFLLKEKKKQDKDIHNSHRCLTVSCKFLVVHLHSKKKQNIEKEETKSVLCSSDKIIHLIQPRKLT